MAVNSWDSEENVMGADSTGDQTLDEGVGMERAAIDDTLSLAAFVGESAHQGAFFRQVAVEVGIINGQNTLGTLYTYNTIVLVYTI